jgi:hypothetical protein
LGEVIGIPGALELKNQTTLQEQQHRMLKKGKKGRKEAKLLTFSAIASTRDDGDTGR